MRPARARAEQHQTNRQLRTQAKAERDGESQDRKQDELRAETDHDRPRLLEDTAKVVDHEPETHREHDHGDGERQEVLNRDALFFHDSGSIRWNSCPDDTRHVQPGHHSSR